MSATPPMIATVHPEATAEEVAAILAAASVLWAGRAPAPAPAQPDVASWRFSGRWWSRPVAARRDRP